MFSLRQQQIKYINSDDKVPWRGMMYIQGISKGLANVCATSMYPIGRVLEEGGCV